jgi:hypothetical protein
MNAIQGRIDTKIDRKKTQNKDMMFVLMKIETMETEEYFKIEILTRNIKDLYFNVIIAE